MSLTRKLSILIIPGNIPYPPSDGGKLCVFGLVDYLRQFHDIEILLTSGNHSQNKNIEDLTAIWPDVKIHNLQLFDLNPQKISIKQQTINSLKKIARKLFASKLTNNAVTNVYSKYDAIHSMPFQPHAEPFIKQLAQLVASKKFDIVQTETTPLLNLVNVLPKDVKKVFVQIEGRRDVLYDYGVVNNFDANYIKHVAGNAEFMEHAYMAKYNAVLTLNESDNISISKHMPQQVKVYTSPYGILNQDIIPPDIASYNSENLIFIGSEAHYPNFDGMNWFFNEVLPTFKTIPFKKIIITGNWSEMTKNTYRGKFSNTDFVGFVDELHPYLKNSVSIVPIRIGGGGIRTKILSSMGMGSAVVTTSLAAVGIKGRDKQELLIADTAKGFSNAIETLFKDRAFATSIIQNGHQLIVSEYSQTVTGAIRNRIYQQISTE